MEARFLGWVVITHWLSHTLVQIFLHLILVHKKVWCYLTSLSIQTGVLALTFHITLLFSKKKKHPNDCILIAKNLKG